MSTLPMNEDGGWSVGHAGRLGRDLDGEGIFGRLEADGEPGFAGLTSGDFGLPQLPFSGLSQAYEGDGWGFEMPSEAPFTLPAAPVEAFAAQDLLLQDVAPRDASELGFSCHEANPDNDAGFHDDAGANSGMSLDSYFDH